jgi:single-strand DNA-binding protein
LSINRVVISGNLTRDAELRSTTASLPVLGISVAVNDRRRNQSSGEWEDFPNYIDCTMFGARAESIAGFLKKGTKVAIEGKLRWSQWERDGQKRSKIEVIVDEIEFLSARDGSGQSKASSYPASSSSDIPPAPEISVYDEDIPF